MWVHTRRAQIGSRVAATARSALHKALDIHLDTLQSGEWVLRDCVCVCAEALRWVGSCGSSKTRGGVTSNCRAAAQCARLRDGETIVAGPRRSKHYW